MNNTRPKDKDACLVRDFYFENREKGCFWPMKRVQNSQPASHSQLHFDGIKVFG
jgi:hypothetical protein